MQRTTVNRLGIAADEIPGWEALRASTGPYVTAYVDTAVRDVSTPKQIALSWREATESLRAAGATEGIIKAVGDRLVDAHQRAMSVGIIANADGVVVEHEFDEPHPTRASWSCLPTLTPLIDWLQSREPHVVVVVDHAGADLALFDRYSGTRVETLGEEDRSDPDLHHAKPGGWSQPRYQRRVKGRWRANAGEAAQRLVQIVDELRPRVIGVGGDVRSVQMFLEQLPSTVREQVREVHGTRARDGGDQRHEDEVARLVRTVVAEDTVQVVQKFSEEIGQQDLAVAGAGPTIAALAEARVETLLVHDDPADSRTAWISRDLGVVSTTRDDLVALGARDPEEGRLTDVAVYAALASGASVRVTPRIAVLDKGIGATLRH